MIEEDDCPEFLRPRLRLFMSADIIGSTAQKQSKLGAIEAGAKANDVSWFTTIQGFYFEAQQSFRIVWRDLDKLRLPDEYLGDSPKLWKTVGDEVLFTKVVSDHRQVLTTVHSWMRVLDDILKFLHREGKGRLGVKSTIWLAGFPIRNKEVVLSGESFSGTGPIGDYFTESGEILNKYYSNTDSSKINIDYIGPSIDTGFRLTSLASARKLIVSVEVAYVLALTARVTKQHIAPLDMRFDGEVPLKGVLGGSGYPVFWIDLAGAGDAAVHADTLLGVVKVDRDTVSKYCAAFFSEKEDFIFPPFVSSKTEGMIGTVPSWYKEQHSNLVKWFDPDQQDSAVGKQFEETDSAVSVSDPNFIRGLQSLSDMLNQLTVGQSVIAKQVPLDEKKPVKDPET